MENIKLITKMELDDFLKQREHICELIEVKTIELARILHERNPIGEICEIDIEESPFEQGCIFVEFEEYFCGESCKDQYNLPFEFLYNEKYPNHYKYLHGEKQRKLNEQRESDEILRQIKERTALENYERSEFLRLKEKYEKFGGD